MTEKDIKSSRSRVVLDTSILTNPESRQYFGEDLPSAIKKICFLVQECGFELYIPSSVFKELSNFVPAKELTGLRILAVVRNPDLYNLQVPAAIFHAFIHKLRQRVNKGLQVAEKAIERDNLPENIRWVRQHYREALRSGILDSTEDLEVVLMAREVQGLVLTEDQGICSMASDLGLEVFNALDFVHYCQGVMKEDDFARPGSRN
ncbi:Protein of unknown function UPF0278 [Desulfonatronospira thiodismutans ASO3-1]|uniref:RNA-free ribonuclease P n=1 Tax=Desulfonatronospira thiodismutans ASO3-1 TaxID=555779 RepID=D6SPH5_9BACT|nr:MULTISPECIES: RNA ligase partner protein [Desulfonatronospira]EFI34651.1 Protein of unknown function UPF0278 [Desulfonatronospira thiodismutans ASO3-1]